MTATRSVKLLGKSDRRETCRNMGVVPETVPSTHLQSLYPRVFPGPFNAFLRSLPPPLCAGATVIVVTCLIVVGQTDVPRKVLLSNIALQRKECL